jgi:hypothetical protein
VVGRDARTQYFLEVMFEIPKGQAPFGGLTDTSSSPSSSQTEKNRKSGHQPEAGTAAPGKVNANMG